MRRRLVRALAWTAVGLGLVLGSRETGAAERVRIAVLPVVVHSLDGVDHLRAGLSDMLVSRLGRDARLAVIPVTDPAAATRDRAAARERARVEGAAWVVFGSFTHFGGGASLDLECAPVGAGDARSVFAESNVLGEIIPKLEPVAEKIARHVLHGTTPEGRPDAPGLARENELDALRRRVEALERALAEARGAASAAPGEAASPGPEPSALR